MPSGYMSWMTFFTKRKKGKYELEIHRLHLCMYCYQVNSEGVATGIDSDPNRTWLDINSNLAAGHINEQTNKQTTKRIKSSTLIGTLWSNCARNKHEFIESLFIERIIFSKEQRKRQRQLLLVVREIRRSASKQLKAAKLKKIRYAGLKGNTG